MVKRVRNYKVVVAAAAAVCATVIICICAATCAGGKIVFNADYYFVCYRITDNSISASSLSDTVSSYGGAGYILNYNGNYYVTMSCYYKKTDAETVCSSLKKRDLDCSVLEVSTDNFKLESYYAKKNSSLYLGNLNTLNSLSTLAYECANGLDTGELNQGKAKEIVVAVKNGLSGLLLSNANNCFTRGLNALIAECEDKERGYLLSKDMRFLQIAVIDLILNTQLL